MNFLLTNIIMMRQGTIFIDKHEITEKRKSKPLLIIKDCMEKHMLVFSPDHNPSGIKLLTRLTLTIN